MVFKEYVCPRCGVKTLLKTISIFQFNGVAMLKKLLTPLLFLCVLISSSVYAQTNDFFSKEFWQKATVADVQKAIKNGADVKSRNEEGRTPFMIQMDLIMHVADVNACTKDGWTPLMLASRYNSKPRIIEALIKHGADVKARNKEEKTAFDYAKGNDKLYNTKAYWKMNDLMYK